MKEIIKPGRPDLPKPVPKIPVWGGECLECGCLFEYTKDEMKRKERVLDSSGRYCYVICPQEGCSKEIFLYDY